MKITRFRTETDAEPKTGIIADGHVYELHAAEDPERPHPFKQAVRTATKEGPSAIESLRDEAPTASRETVELLAPVAGESRVFCLGAIYTGHMQEEELDLTFDPNQWIMPENAVVGPNSSIELPERVAENVEPAAELGVVIGQRGKYIDPIEAHEYIAGYTVSNDVTARTEWPGPMGYKMLDSFSPVGPYIRTADEVGDTMNLDIEMRQDGTTICQGNTAGMRFSLSFLVSYMSTIVELVPGDVISTGDPGGVSENLRPGSTLETEIEDVGTLRNTVTTER